MGNKVAIAEKVFWKCGLDVTTGGVKYRASNMFIKTVLKAAFGCPNVYLSLFHVVWPVFAVVFFTVILFLSFSTRLIAILFDPTLSYIDRPRFLQRFFKPYFHHLLRLIHWHQLAPITSQCDFQCLMLPTIQKYLLLRKLKQRIKQLRMDRNSKNVNLAKRIILSQKTEHISCNVILK